MFSYHECTEQSIFSLSLYWRPCGLIHFHNAKIHFLVSKEGSHIHLPISVQRKVCVVNGVPSSLRLGFPLGIRCIKGKQVQTGVVRLQVVWLEREISASSVASCGVLPKNKGDITAPKTMNLYLMEWWTENTWLSNLGIKTFLCLWICALN